MTDATIETVQADIFYTHGGGELTPGWYINTPNGGIGPFESKEAAERGHIATKPEVKIS